VFAWYVHLFSLAVGSTCLPASQTIPWNADGPIFPFFCPVWFPFRWGCWIQSNRDSESRQTMKKVIVYRRSGGTKAESMFCSMSHWLVHGAVLCKSSSSASIGSPTDSELNWYYSSLPFYPHLTCYSKSL